MQRFLRPRAPLSDFVEVLWHRSGSPVAHELERLLPTGTVELVIDLSDAPLRCYDPGSLELCASVRGPLLSGVRESYAVIEAPAAQEIVGAQFRPGGGHALLGLPVDEVQGLDLPLSALWGAAADELYDRLLSEKSAERRLAILEAVLLGRLRANSRLHPVIRGAIARLERSEEPVDISDLAAAAGWSDRYFIRQFSAQVGITPKTFARVRRFQAALRVMQGETVAEWVEIALSSGYYDQAHFIRDFKGFAGITPGAYRRTIVEEGSGRVPMGRPDAGTVAAA